MEKKFEKIREMFDEDIEIDVKELIRELKNYKIKNMRKRDEGGTISLFKRYKEHGDLKEKRTSFSIINTFYGYSLIKRPMKDEIYNITQQKFEKR